MSHRPVCVTCRVEMRPQKNDVAAVEMDGDVQTAIWSADLWRCPDCSHEIIMGFGARPLVTELRTVADLLSRQHGYEFWASIETRL